MDWKDLLRFILRSADVGKLPKYIKTPLAFMALLACLCTIVVIVLSMKYDISNKIFILATIFFVHIWILIGVFVLLILKTPIALISDSHTHLKIVRFLAEAAKTHAFVDLIRDEVEGIGPEREEKRNAYRKSAKIGVELTLVPMVGKQAAGNGNPKRGNICNISSTGAQIETPFTVTEDVHVVLHLRSRNRFLPKDVVAKTRWAAMPKTPIDQWRCGVEFIPEEGLKKSLPRDIYRMLPKAVHRFNDRAQREFDRYLCSTSSKNWGR